MRRVFAQMPADMLVRFEPGSEVAAGHPLGGRLRPHAGPHAVRGDGRRAQDVRLRGPT
ncbi:MAG: hypothetical protein MZW92_40960 [Comamonadaceae bacterium]|nr:hypothetical protein [Comamonadaceae bacterium]